MFTESIEMVTQIASDLAENASDNSPEVVEVGYARSAFGIDEPSNIEVLYENEALKYLQELKDHLKADLEDIRAFKESGIEFVDIGFGIPPDIDWVISEYERIIYQIEYVQNAGFPEDKTKEALMLLYEDAAKLHKQAEDYILRGMSV